MIKEISRAAYIGNLVGMYVSKAVVARNVIKGKDSRLKFFTENIAKKSKQALKKLNFEVHVHGFDKELMANNNFLLIGNHLSYLDILVMSSTIPVVFVTSVDLAESGFLGTLAELGGSLFVERRNRSKIESDLRNITRVLEDGFNVMIYPEGTSGNGETVMPFKKSLFMSAVKSGKDILPVCIRYSVINGEPFSIENRDKVCWYGDMTFIPHFLQLLKTKKVIVDLIFLNVVKTTPESTRDKLAQECHDQITNAYFKGPFTDPNGPRAKDSAEYQ